MGRKNYMTISVADTIQDMFNEFVARMHITKTVALNNVLEMYMLAVVIGIIALLIWIFLMMEIAYNKIIINFKWRNVYVNFRKSNWIVAENAGKQT